MLFRFVYTQADKRSKYLDWFMDNITALCTSSCSSSLSSWLSVVESSCTSETLNFMGSVMQAKTLPIVFQNGYDIACLQDRYKLSPIFTRNQVLTRFCIATRTGASSSRKIGKEATLSGKRFYQRASIDSQNLILFSRYDPEMCWNADPSQNPPECNNATFVTTDVTPDMMAVTSLYPNSLVSCMHDRSDKATVNRILVFHFVV